MISRKCMDEGGEGEGEGGRGREWGEGGERKIPVQRLYRDLRYKMLNVRVRPAPRIILSVAR